MKKGRHRRFQEARDLKRGFETVAEPCVECGAEPGSEHASWCLAMEDEEVEGAEVEGEEVEDEEEQDQPEQVGRATGLSGGSGISGVLPGDAMS